MKVNHKVINNNSRVAKQTMTVEQNKETHEQLDNQVLPFLQSSNLDFIKDDTCFHFNIYSES